MGFTHTLTGFLSRGNKKGSYGTWDSDSTTGGNIDTGLSLCEGMTLQTNGAAVSADQSSVNETFPIAGNAITIKTTSDTDGYWEAWGI